VAPWQEQFKALDCSNPRYDSEVLQVEPLLAAILTTCHRPPFKRNTPGWQTLVTIDAGTQQVRAVPTASIYSGGLHFTQDGDVIWYSSRTLVEDASKQLYVEAYALRKGELQERLLGRIPMPFVSGPGVGHVEGEGCQLVAFHNFRADDKSPHLQQIFLVNDREPFESARRLEGIGRGLFWDPVRKSFVVQTKPHRALGVPGSDPLERKTLDCSGQTGELDAELRRRLALITDENAQFHVSRQGHLAVGSEKAGSGEQEIVVFRGEQIQRIAARQSFASCPDLHCEPFYELLFAGPWSSSGEYFMVDRGFDLVEIYRASDMQMVKQWAMKDFGKFPVHGFLNDRAAFEFNDHSRLTFHTW